MRPAHLSAQQLGQSTAAATPLPVQLVAFTATATGPDRVRLAWHTASETNSARFVVERSTDGAAFGAVGTVAAAGHSSTPRAYAWPDAGLPAGRYYYRLRQLDHDGTATLTGVRVVVLDGASQLVLYPNPAPAGGAQLRGAVPGSPVRVLDALGRPVAQALAGADGTTVLGGLPPGLYLVQAGAATLRLVVE